MRTRWPTTDLCEAVISTPTRTYLLKQIPWNVCPSTTCESIPNFIPGLHFLQASMFQEQFYQLLVGLLDFHASSTMYLKKDQKDLNPYEPIFVLDNQVIIVQAILNFTPKN